MIQWKLLRKTDGRDYGDDDEDDEKNGRESKKKRAGKDRETVIKCECDTERGSKGAWIRVGGHEMNDAKGRS